MTKVDEKYNELTELLKKCEKTNVLRFVAYCKTKELETKDGNPKNPHFSRLSAKKLSEMYERVIHEGLVFDGKHVAITARGINYDYVAYKNKMYIAYPDSELDVQLVYKDDKFSFTKKDGRVHYTHDIGDAFGQREDHIVGGYCIIKNKRGEFLTMMSLGDFKHHQKYSTMKSIWEEWFPEMCLKSLFRKGTKAHFEDVFEKMNEDDNKYYDLDKKVSSSSDVFNDAHKTHMDKADSLDELEMYADSVPELINVGEFQAYYAITLRRIKDKK